MADRQELEEHPLTIRAGNNYYSLIDELVWGPFLILFGGAALGLLFGVGVLLPEHLSEQFGDVALGWVNLLYGNTGLLPIASAVGWIVVTVVAFKMYLRLFVRVAP